MTMSWKSTHSKILKLKVIAAVGWPTLLQYLAHNVPAPHRNVSTSCIVQSPSFLQSFIAEVFSPSQNGPEREGGGFLFHSVPYRTYFYTFKYNFFSELMQMKISVNNKPVSSKIQNLSDDVGAVEGLYSVLSVQMTWHLSLTDHLHRVYHTKP